MNTPFIQFGFDPGAKGGWAAINDQCRVVGHGKLFPFIEAYDPIRRILDGMREVHIPVFGAFEDVHAFAHDGRKSANTFGKNTGESIGMLKALNFWPLELVRPQEWQHRMRCATGGDKRVSLCKAKALFPEVEVNHFIADALLIAEDARRRRAAK